MRQHHNGLLAALSFRWAASQHYLYCFNKGNAAEFSKAAQSLLIARFISKCQLSTKTKLLLGYAKCISLGAVKDNELCTITVLGSGACKKGATSQRPQVCACWHTGFISDMVSLSRCNADDDTGQHCQIYSSTLYHLTLTRVFFITDFTLVFHPTGRKRKRLPSSMLMYAWGLNLE